MNQDLINQGVIITRMGESLIENAAISGVSLKLKQFSIGDGASDTFNPTYETLKALTAIPGEWDKRNLIDVYPNSEGAGYIAEGLVPHDVGEGKYCRIAGYWTVDNKLFAVHLIPAWQKPANSGNLLVELPLKAYFSISDQASLTLSIDPSLVQATRDYVDREIAEQKATTDSTLASYAHKSLIRNAANNYIVRKKDTVRMGTEHQVYVFDDGISKNLNIEALTLTVGDVLELQKIASAGRLDITRTDGLIDVRGGIAEANHYLPEGKVGTLFFECVAVGKLLYKGGY
ncbi:phage tail protein [Shewanella frigidimarina]|uniref:phage tail-collar fiber domain-containing protein n=1 Tax=Shewanella frigidimarina TaxID=56812 RepID=UPI003D7B1693